MLRGRIIAIAFIAALLLSALQFTAAHHNGLEVHAWHEPWWPTENDEVTVYAEVESESGAITSVVLYYSVDNSSWEAVEMAAMFYEEYDDEVYGIYNATIPPQPAGTTVTYYVEATSESDDVATSKVHEYTVAGYTSEVYVYAWHEPWWPTENDEVTVYAEVITYGAEASGATLYYSADNETWTSVEMQPWEEWEEDEWYECHCGCYPGEYDLFYATIPPHPANTTVYYYVEAWDTEGNVGYSDMESYTVVGGTPPAQVFISTWHEPEVPTQEDEVEVFAEITAVGVEIVDARLFYSIDNETWWEECMELEYWGSDEIANYYMAYGWIPPFPNGTEVWYYVEVYDAEWNAYDSETNHYIVGEEMDYNPPVIEDVWHEPEEPNAYENVTVYAVIYDEDSYVDWAGLFYATSNGTFDAVEMVEVDENLWAGIIPGQPAGSVVVYAVVAADANGNIGFSDIYYYTVGGGEGEEPEYTLTVQVLWTNQTPVNGALVAVYKAEGELLLVNVTNGYGLVEFRLPEGEYYVAAAYGVYYNYTTVELEGDMLVRLTLNASLTVKTIEEDEALRVVAVVDGLGENVEAATLYYSTDGSSWSSTTMSSVSSRIYVADVPAEGESVQYYVEVTDSAGQTLRSNVQEVSLTGGAPGAPSVGGGSPATPVAPLALLLSAIVVAAIERRRIKF
mgnify:CR=1 FL=1